MLGRKIFRRSVQRAVDRKIAGPFFIVVSSILSIDHSFTELFICQAIFA